MRAATSRAIAQRLGLSKPSKYRAQPVVVDGFRFASKREAMRYGMLKLRERAEEIACLELQPSYDLVVGGAGIGRYIADFRYYERATGRWIVEDVKGVRTPVYRLKKKLVEALYGITIEEVA